MIPHTCFKGIPAIAFSKQLLYHSPLSHLIYSQHSLIICYYYTVLKWLPSSFVFSTQLLLTIFKGLGFLQWRLLRLLQHLRVVPSPLPPSFPLFPLCPSEPRLSTRFYKIVSLSSLARLAVVSFFTPLPC